MVLNYPEYFLQKKKLYYLKEANFYKKVYNTIYYSIYIAIYNKNKNFFYPFLKERFDM